MPTGFAAKMIFFEHRVNLVNLVHSSLKMLPYLDEHFAKYQNASPQSYEAI